MASIGRRLWRGRSWTTRTSLKWTAGAAVVFGGVAVITLFNRIIESGASGLSLNGIVSGLTIYLMFVWVVFMNALVGVYLYGRFGRNRD